MELPNVHAFSRVKDEMQQIALELLVDEEIRQDDQEKARKTHELRNELPNL
jgi:hypothetical protein